MKQAWTIAVYRKDLRTRAGERLVSHMAWLDMTEDEVKVACLVYNTEKLRAHYYPKYKVVKNLMTDELVVLDTDTPRSCDPSTELYWSM